MTRLLVIGASAGGIDALMRIMEDLPVLPAAVLVVVHVGTNHSRLPDLLQARGRMPARHARQGDTLRAGTILVAPPDHHLLVMGDRLVTSRGPKENHTRPAIDPLFRSAALAYGRDVIGVVLTGRLDDGTAGLQAIKSMGGLAVVQDPAEAAWPSMPSSAVRHVDVDHVVGLAEMAPLLSGLCAQAPPPWRGGARDDAAAPWLAEQALTLGHDAPIEQLHQLGSPSTFTCPDCHGSLWAVRGDGPPRFRCHTGHGYTLATLRASMAETLDDALWNGLRALQENAIVLQALADAEPDDGGRVATLRALAGKISAEAQALRSLIADNVSTADE